MPLMIKDKKKCSGCHACFNICPKQCISMIEDEEGFLYPDTNDKECVNCGLCEKVCPIINPTTPPENHNHLKSYAAINKDELIRSKSSSGGIFSVIAQSVIDRSGVVFGAAFHDDYSVQSICVEAEEDLEKLRGSKYVQSTIGSSYSQAKSYLDSGRLVLFSGTPCQIGGLHAFLQKEYDNLITVDLICHGVPSPMVWRKYVDYRQQIADSEAKEISFRNKKDGWKNYSMYFDFSDNTNYTVQFSKDPYMQVFLKNYCLRPSCYACSFKTESRHADITLADFWGIERINPQMDDDKGTSLVIVHSDNGEKWFESVSDKIICEAIDFSQYYSFNYSYLHSVQMPKERNKYLKRIKDHTFEEATHYLKKEVEKNKLKVEIKNDLKKKRFRRVFRKIKRYCINKET